MFFDLARASIGLKRSMDSAIEQFVLALEKASVAAAKTDISVENGGELPTISLVGHADGISLGSLVDVLEAGGSCSIFGEDSGVGGAFDGFASSVALRKFCKPFMFGTRKLYEIW